MKLIMTFGLLLGTLGASSQAIRSLPDFGATSPVNGSYSRQEYQLLILGGVGCGFSQAALTELTQLDSLCPDLQKIVIEPEGRNVISESQSHLFSSYTFFSNEELNFKHKQIYPQVYLFVNGCPMGQIRGKGVFNKIRAKVPCSK